VFYSLIFCGLFASRGIIDTKGHGLLNAGDMVKATLSAVVLTNANFPILLYLCTVLKIDLLNGFNH
jgi:hypothetical protein